jgi:hypothetical protein
MAATGVFTDLYREKYADLAGDLVTDEDEMPLVWFAVGEGGYTTSGSSKVPKAPDSTRTALEATIIPSSTSTSSTGMIYIKTLGSGTVVVSGETVTITCELSATETGLDNNSHLTGNYLGSPELFELGVFDGDPAAADPYVAGLGDMIAYCTFDEIVKVSGTAVTIVVTISM